MSENNHHHKIVFDRSGVSWFAVPNHLFRIKSIRVGSTDQWPLINRLSAAGLRLYLYILSRADGQPFVEITNDKAANHAGVGKNHIKKTRSELRRLGLVSFSDSDPTHIEIVNPATRGRLPTALAKVKAGPYTPEQIEAVFRYYLRNEQLEDDGNGLRFFCPFHTSEVDKARLRKQHPLSVKKDSSVGLWQCTSPKCKHHGRRRTVVLPDEWDEPKEEVSTGGGGDLLDFISAMAQHNESKQISRQVAAARVQAILEDV